MLKKLKRNWRLLRQSKPGQRFQDRYQRRQDQREGRFDGWKYFNITAGLAVAAAGLFLLPAPGPGVPVLIVGLGLIGGEFLVLARFLDWTELRVRKLIKSAWRLWGRSKWVARVAMLLAAFCCLAGVAWGSYRLVMGHER